MNHTPEQSDEKDIFSRRGSALVRRVARRGDAGGSEGLVDRELIDANIRSDWRKLSMILAAQRHAEMFDDVLPLTEELAENDGLFRDPRTVVFLAELK